MFILIPMYAFRIRIEYSNAFLHSVHWGIIPLPTPHSKTLPLPFRQTPPLNLQTV